MKYVLLVALVVDVISLFVNYVLFKKVKDKQSAIERQEELYNGLQKEFNTLVEAEKAKSKRRKEADEKNENLHNGNSVTNAINQLFNNKS